MAQQRALGRRLSPSQTQAALTGERAGELQAYYDQYDRNRMRRLQEQQLALAESSQGFRQQQAQAADAAARNQAILGYTGLGLGALNYFGRPAYNAIRDWFRPGEQAVTGPSGNIDTTIYPSLGPSYYQDMYGGNFNNLGDFGMDTYSFPDLDYSQMGDFGNLDFDFNSLGYIG
jgi:hypothetical protein